MALLEVQDIHAYYGNIHALNGISLTVEEGEIVTLIGANGAGKTTTLRAISGLLPPRSGIITYDGDDLSKFKAHEIVYKNISMVPEGRGIFSRLTVSENLDMGAFSRKDKEGIKEDRERVFKLFPRLKERLDQVAGTLSGGEQQMLAIARGLMSRPKLLMLDEPSLGIAPNLVTRIFATIEKIRKRGLTVLMVEQHVQEALENADRGYILQTGRIALQGVAKELLSSDLVQKAYLGI